MNTKIRTNRIISSINLQQFEERFDVFKLKTSKDYFRSGANILDIQFATNIINSIRFTSGNEILVLMEKRPQNRADLLNVIKNSDDYEFISIHNINPSSLKQNIILQLLLNAMGNFEFDLLKFNNITGHLYCYRSSWFQRDKKDESIIYKIPALEVCVDEEMNLHLHVHTFTSEKLKKQIEFKKKKFDEYPKYVLTNNKTLRRKLTSDEGPCFIMRQTKNNKIEIPFLDISNLENFEETKIGVLSEVVDKFNKKYKNIASISFEEIEECESLEYTAVTAKENKNAIATALSDKKIKIVDLIGDQYSSLFCEDIRKVLKEEYKTESTTGKRVAKDCLNICLIHNKDYYNGENDPYLNDANEDISIQHVTFEDFKSNKKFAVKTVIHELLIKDDLVKKKISLFDWNSIISEEMSFGIQYVDNEDKKKYFFMDIKKDGTFNIREQELNLFEENNYSDCINIFEEDNSCVVKGIIKTETSGINIIEDTRMYTIPKFEDIKDRLQSGDTCLRGNKVRNELMNSILDVKTFNNSRDGINYFVGSIGRGMQTVVNRASLIRRVRKYEDSTLFFNELLPTMNVTYVRNGQLTIVPFPFKYLREYLNMTVK